MWEPMLGEGPDRGERIQTIVKDTPFRRFGRVDEVAAVTVLLASNEAAYMTGTEINIDGGLLAGSTASPKRTER
jgi:NAD(P)-dependent dehydrogenase (short-subunit alcohol dehydrogenase family)